MSTTEKIEKPEWAKRMEERREAREARKEEAARQALEQDLLSSSGYQAITFMLLKMLVEQGLISQDAARGLALGADFNEARRVVYNLSVAVGRITPPPGIEVNLGEFYEEMERVGPRFKECNSLTEAVEAYEKVFSFLVPSDTAWQRLKSMIRMLDGRGDD
jgi:hypothetical protein